MVGGTGTAAIVIDKFCVSESDKESVTSTVKAEVPGDVGLPEITPVVGARLRFDGNDPEVTLQTRVPVPPEACRVWL